MYCLRTFCQRATRKKLKRAARYLIHRGDGADGQDELEADAEVFGVVLPDAAVGASRIITGHSPVQSFAVLPENWDTVRAFMAVQTQWRYGQSGHPIGLDYAGVRVACSAMGIRFKTVFASLQVMEYEVLSER